MPVQPSTAQKWLAPARRIVAVTALLYGVIVLALCFADALGAVSEWPYTPLRHSGDDFLAVLDAEGRSGGTDTAMVGFAARAASPPTGPSAVVLPLSDDDLHEPVIYGERRIPWINQRLLDDLVAMKVERATYETAIEPDLVDALIQSGELVEFASAVLAPPEGSIDYQDRLAVYYLSRDDRFVLLPDTVVSLYRETRP